MAYDFAGNFNQTNYNPSGFGGRQQGGRFAAYYGRDQDGNLRTGPSGQAQPTPAAPPAAPGMNQGGPQGDFFAQLAGLLGGGQGGAPSNSSRFGESRYQDVAPGLESRAYAKTLPPAQYNQYMAMYGARDDVSARSQAAGLGSNANTQNGGGNIAPPTTQGPGSYSRAVQEGGARGRATAVGRASSGRTNSGQTNPGGMAPPLRPRGPMPLPNTKNPTPMGEAKPSESFGRPRQFGGISNTRKQAGGFGGKF